jgi:hypothetical protein
MGGLVPVGAGYGRRRVLPVAVGLGWEHAEAARLPGWVEYFVEWLQEPPNGVLKPPGLGKYNGCESSEITAVMKWRR